MMTAMSDLLARDTVRLVDGPLAGRVFTFNATPTVAQEFHACVGTDGRVLAAEGDLAPVNIPYRPVEYVYGPVMAPDGFQSRADDGRLPFYYLGEVAE